MLGWFRPRDALVSTKLPAGLVRDIAPGTVERFGLVYRTRGCMAFLCASLCLCMYAALELAVKASPQSPQLSVWVWDL